MCSHLLRAFVPAVVCLALLACGGTDTARTAMSQSPDPKPSPPSPPDGPLAQVDRMDVPDQIAPTDTLPVQLSGTVGPNGCYSLDRIETERGPGQVTLRPVVQPPTDEDQMCTMAIVPLDATHRVPPPFEAGTLSVTVPQEDGPAVTDTVEVTDGS
jgi:hypothetical protein